MTLHFLAQVPPLQGLCLHFSYNTADYALGNPSMTGTCTEPKTVQQGSAFVRQMLCFANVQGLGPIKEYIVASLNLREVLYNTHLPAAVRCPCQ